MRSQNTGNPYDDEQLHQQFVLAVLAMIVTFILGVELGAAAF